MPNTKKHHYLFSRIVVFMLLKNYVVIEIKLFYTKYFSVVKMKPLLLRYLATWSSFFSTGSNSSHAIPQTIILYLLSMTVILFSTSSLLSSTNTSQSCTFSRQFSKPLSKQRFHYVFDKTKALFQN